MSKFDEDLARGQKGERVAAGIMKRLKKASSIDFEFAGTRHDFILRFADGRRAIRYEVKCDFLSQKTSNIFLEYECSGKPSGLSATQAHQWVIVLEHDNYILVFCPRRMLQWLRDNKARKVNGGDNRAAKGYLLPLISAAALPFINKHPIK